MKIGFRALIKMGIFLEKMQSILNHLDPQMRHAIGLMKMHLSSYENQIVEMFSDSQQDWGYAKIQQSLQFELVLVLCRFYDKDKSAMSFPALFRSAAVKPEFNTWFDSLGDNRKRSFQEAKLEMEKLQQADSLKKVLYLRDKFWGHSDKKVKMARVAEFEDLDYLYDLTKEIVQKLVYAVFDRDANFEDAENVFKKEADAFFEVLGCGQKNYIQQRNVQLAELGGREPDLEEIKRRRSE